MKVCLSVYWSSHYWSVSVCVRVSLSTILKVSKTAGMLLKPHVSLLVISLLESVTTLEPQMMNYLSLHAAANQDSADKVPPCHTDRPSDSIATVQLDWFIFTRDSIYAIARICYRPSLRLSVLRLSVRWWYHRKTVEVKIMKFSPYGSPIPLVFAG